MSNQQKNNNLKDQVQNLNSHLVLIKSLKEPEAEKQFCNLLEKAKQIFGELSPYMARFYYEYGGFLLNKIQNSMDLFNPDAVPEAGADEEDAQYESAYEEQDYVDQNGANAQEVQKPEKKQEKVEQKSEKEAQNEEKVIYEDQNVQILSNDNDKDNQKMKQKQEQVESNKGDNQQDYSDLQIAYDNLQVALKIYLKERQKLENGEDSVISKDDIFHYILCLHIRIGELYMFDERFDDAISEYYAAIKMTRQTDKHEMRRRASESYYNIGNCLLHLNKENCEIQAIKEYICAHEELLRFIAEKQNYDISQIEVPSVDKLKVDRFGYLYRPFDSELVRDIKDVMSLLLDKIEDTALQIETRPTYEKEKARINQQKQNDVFKEVSKDVKVTNLGTFGNRKKAQPISTIEENQNSNEKNTTPVNPESAEKMDKKQQAKSQTKGQQDYRDLIKVQLHSAKNS